MNAPAARWRHSARGVGLVELLMSLAICAALLTAVAFAVDASFKSYQINQEQSSLMQRARLAMHRMTCSIRAAREHSPTTESAATQFAGGSIVTDAGLSMFDDSGVEVVYQYDASTHRLVAIADGQSHVLLEGVQDLQIRMEPMRSVAAIRTGGGWDLLKRATITLTLATTDTTARPTETTGRQVVTLSASVMPRRNCW